MILPQRHCKQCGKLFQPNNNTHIYCKQACREKAYKKSIRRRMLDAINFITEWRRWKEDFAAGKTVSNL